MKTITKLQDFKDTASISTFDEIFGDAAMHLFHKFNDIFERDLYRLFRSLDIENERKLSAHLGIN